MSSKKPSQQLDLLNIMLCSGVLFIRLPPFVFFGSSFLSTHNIARVLFIVAFFFLMANKKFHAKLNIEVFLLSLLLVCVSLSSLISTNMTDFLSLYKNITMAIVLLIAISLYKQKLDTKLFVNTLFLSVIVNLTIEALLFSNNPIFSFGFKHIVQTKYLSLFNYQLGRGRMFGDTLDEAFIPILLINLFSSKKQIRILSFISIIFMLYLVYFSGWRTKLLIYAFELIAGCFFLLKKRSILIFIIVIISAFILHKLPNTANTNTFTRFLLTDEQDIKTINTRFNYWDSSLKIGLSSPILGVGLGNYFDNLSLVEKNNNQDIPLNRIGKTIIIDDPHNIFLSLFATTGLFSFLIYFVLCIRYLKYDILSFNIYLAEQKALCLGYWGFFIYALLNPWLNFYFVMMFFIMRGYLMNCPAAELRGIK